MRSTASIFPLLPLSRAAHSIVCSAESNMKTRIAGALFIFLLINSGYIAAYPAPSLFYMGNVVAHLAVGLLLMVAALFAVKRYPRESGAFLAAGLVAVFLVMRGNTLDHRSILWLHILLGVAGAGVVAVRFRR